MGSLGWEAWTTLGVIGVVFALLIFSKIAADIVMIGGMTLLLLFGIITPKEALSGMSNEGMITVGVLYVVVAGLQQTGSMSMVASRIFGQPQSVLGAQIRMMLPVATISGFMNNTPLVAMMLPVVNDWGKKFKIPAGKLMMPLSFATILGGICTLIGTSTNVIASGLLRDAIQAGTVQGEPMGMFTLAWIGVPAAIVGIAYMLLASKWLLPDRKPAITTTDDPRRYTTEMLVATGGAVDGKTIEEAGLRRLPGVYLAEVERKGEIIPAVGPTLRLQGEDRLIFVGVVESVVELQKIRGVHPATNQVFKLEGPRSRRILIEAVVSDKCPVIGKSVRKSSFRTLYNAVIIAAARGGERLNQKIGDIVLRPGDTLLLEARPAFLEQQKGSRDFYLVSAVEDSSPPRHEKAWVAVAILIGMVACATVFEQVRWFQEKQFSMLHAAMLAAGLMLMTRCCAPTAARKAVDWQVLLLIASAFGIGKALEKTGAADAIAQSMLSVGGGSPLAALIVLYGATMLFTELLSNATAITLMFPIIIAACNSMGVECMPYLLACTIAASCGFATPIGYQTNLMVYGPGGYRFVDYLRFGGALNVIVWIVTVTCVAVEYRIGW